ncbi:MAG: class F sortase [Propionibacteriaceae bacterium]|jgi:LPXTG-site transpeptidase (sortase) family protein|nr:class F sortase [Propionibacteriaceae bacterium]
MAARRARNWAWRGLLIVLGAALVGSLAVICWPGLANRSEALAIPPIPTVTPTYELPSRTDPLPAGITAEPLHIRIPRMEVETDVAPYTADDARAGKDWLGNPCYRGNRIRCIDPPRFDIVYHQIGGVEGIRFGEYPGLETLGTVYMYGHSAVKQKAVFNNLGKLKSGDAIEIETQYGILEYVVDKVIDIPKEQYSTSEEVWEQVPGRLLLVSCDQSGGSYGNGHAKNNLIAFAHVTGARALS